MFCLQLELQEILYGEREGFLRRATYEARYTSIPFHSVSFMFSWEDLLMIYRRPLRSRLVPFSTIRLIVLLCMFRCWVL